MYNVHTTYYSICITLHVSSWYIRDFEIKWLNIFKTQGVPYPGRGVTLDDLAKVRHTLEELIRQVASLSLNLGSSSSCLPKMVLQQKKCWVMAQQRQFVD